MEGQKENTWLQHVVKRQMPNARVMIFDHGCFAEDGRMLLSEDGLTRAANMLLQNLASRRKDEMVSFTIKLCVLSLAINMHTSHSFAMYQWFS